MSYFQLLTRSDIRGPLHYDLANQTGGWWPLSVTQKWSGAFRAAAVTVTCVWQTWTSVTSGSHCTSVSRCVRTPSAATRAAVTPATNSAPTLAHVSVSAQPPYRPPLSLCTSPHSASVPSPTQPPYRPPLSLRTAPHSASVPAHSASVPAHSASVPAHSACVPAPTQPPYRPTQPPYQPPLSLRTGPLSLRTGPFSLRTGPHSASVPAPTQPPY